MFKINDRLFDEPYVYTLLKAGISVNLERVRSLVLFPNILETLIIEGHESTSFMVIIVVHV